MKKIDKLIEEFPALYRKAPPETGHSKFPFQLHGFYCQMPGWYDILHKLSVQLEPFFVDDQSLYVHQIKEKFGGLRFYISHFPKEREKQIKMLAIIDTAMAESLETCDICGQSGKLTNLNSYICVRCPEHKKSNWRDYE